MAQYVSTSIVNAAQWGPEKIAEMQEVLAEYKNKIKEVRIEQKIPGSKLDVEGVFDPANVQLIVTPVNTSASAVTVAPGSYLLINNAGTFSVLSEKRFNDSYKILDDGTVEPTDPEDPEGPGGDEEPIVPDWNTGSLAQTKTALRAQIMAGNKVLNETMVSTTGDDIATNKYWYTQSDKDALQQAMNSANAVNEGQSTQDEVDAMTQTLKTAIETAKAARQYGLGSIGQGEEEIEL